MSSENPIVATYSKLAKDYDQAGNVDSCWGKVTAEVAQKITLAPHHRRVADVGCGTGWALAELAAKSSPEVDFIGIDPAENMCARAQDLVAEQANVRIEVGSFERLPLEDASIDYLYSTLAFHWCTDVEAAADELARVLQAKGEMDLYFIGRDNGREFIQATTPIFLRYMGPKLLLESAKLRKQLERGEAEELFRKRFPSRQVEVSESMITYRDTLEGHWKWWVRIEGHFVQIPEEKKEACNAAIKEAIGKLGSGDQIPYTIHLLHVSVR